MPRKPSPIEHGTAKGYTKHVKNPERYGPPCDPCSTAHAEYQANYRAKNPEIRAAAARQKSIRQRAMTRLAAIHKTELDALMAEIEQELKESAA